MILFYLIELLRVKKESFVLIYSYFFIMECLFHGLSCLAFFYRLLFVLFIFQLLFFHVIFVRHIFLNHLFFFCIFIICPKNFSCLFTIVVLIYSIFCCSYFRISDSDYFCYTMRFLKIRYLWSMPYTLLLVFSTHILHPWINVSLCDILISIVSILGA